MAGICAEIAHQITDQPEHLRLTQCDGSVKFVVDGHRASCDNAGDAMLAEHAEAEGGTSEA